jgi:glutamine synthetase
VQQEPDASSFPNGELEILLKQEDTPLGILHLQRSFGEQHYVPTVFISYTGEALDYKTPLLRALQVMDEAATDVCKYFDKNVKKVTAT